MLKIFLLLNLFVTTILFGSVGDINKEINNNNAKYQKVAKNKNILGKDIGALVSKIQKEEERHKDIVQVLDSANSKLFLNKLKLSNANKQLIYLKEESKLLKKKKLKIEKDVIDQVIEKYSMSMGIKQAHKETFKNIIDKEIYTLIFQNAKDQVFDLNIDYIKVNKATRRNEDRMSKSNKFIENQKQIQKKYLKKEKEQLKVLKSLKSKHTKYQAHLKKIIKKQDKITDLLGSLRILKNKEIKKEKDRIKKAKALQHKKDLAAKKKILNKRKEHIQSSKRTKKLTYLKKNELDKEIDIEVRKIGSSVKGIKIAKYKGKKTIAPLKSYSITKKFGKYYDKVYKMELFSESISLKTKKKNAKVFSVFKGEIVYAKNDSGLLENVVIVKHRGSLHTIYSHLDKISPTLKVGKWIPKGYVVGRVNDTLLFQATKNSKYIDPLKLFK